jgi:SAM-dependent methyltransferase
MVQIKEISLADTRRLYQYKADLKYDIPFTVKGFDYGWILSARNWQKDDTVLDVGGAYSFLPNYLSTEYGCETWVVDDFGISANDKFWARNHSPHEHIKNHPETRYVLERVGNPETSSLPQSYFNVVYSASALEHVPADLTPAVWRHMLDLLKPGGELIHAVDITFPSNGGVRKIIQATLFDQLPFLFSKQMRLDHCLATPKTYSRLVLKTLDAKTIPPLKNLNLWKMCLDPEVITDSLAFGWNRIVKDGIKDYRHIRFGSLLIHLIKD